MLFHVEFLPLTQKEDNKRKEIRTKLFHQLPKMREPHGIGVDITVLRDNEGEGLSPTMWGNNTASNFQIAPRENS
jgi:hypothetical protein